MKVETDNDSGFCFGVVKAITTAERSIAGSDTVYSLGDIVHNRIEVQRLEGLGLRPLRHEQLASLRDATVLIRAHGEPPGVYATARRNNIKLIDATCPVVARLQEMVKKAHAMMQPVGGQVVILGKKGHAEVVGLTGQVDGDAIVAEGLSDLDTIDFDRPIYLLSQTTQSLSLFESVKESIMARAADPAAVSVHDTICRRVANREPHLREFAAQYDVVIFVSGRKSSNGQVLFEVCRSANPRAWMVEDETELDPRWFADASSVGVCGATSTPKWLMTRVAEKIKTI